MRWKNEPDDLYIKIGDVILQEFDRNLLGNDVFEIDTPDFRFEITNDNGTFTVTNSVDQRGENMQHKFALAPVTFLSYYTPFVLKPLDIIYANDNADPQPKPIDMQGEEITVKKFLLKKFPTNKYFDCPVPSHHWETMQEYAEAYHQSIAGMERK